MTCIRRDVEDSLDRLVGDGCLEGITNRLIEMNIRGRRQCLECCPISEYLRLTVGEMDYLISNHKAWILNIEDGVDLPGEIINWLQEFDSGKRNQCEVNNH